MTISGVLICGISVGLFKRAAFGVDPFQSLMSGLDALIPISFGTLYVLVNVVLLSFSFFVDRHYIGIATFINLFLLGYITQYVLDFLLRTFPDLSVPERILMLAVAIIIMCFGSSLYFVADLGVSTYDAIALVMSEKWHVAKFKYCRIASDFVCVVLGVSLYLLAGGKLSSIMEIAGVATIITAFFMGPLIELFNNKISRPFLNK
ncbi:MAG: hypothetical protein H6Q59_688 [Firmicutes bacterium]|nr:hypothetical protein [Bacillota bacterium]